MAEYQMADLDKWVLATTERMNAVARGSVQRVVEVAQTPRAKGGRMPVDTGALRNSLASSLNGSTALTGGDAFVLVVGDMEAGDVAEFGWTVEYARRVNFGFIDQDSLGRSYNQSGAHFLEGAASQWQQIVEGEVKKAKAAAR